MILLLCEKVVQVLNIFEIIRGEVNIMEQGQFEYLIETSGQLNIKEFMVKNNISEKEVKAKLIIMQTFRSMQMKAKVNHIIDNPCHPNILKILGALCEDANAVALLADKLEQMNHSPSISIERKSNIIPFTKR